MKKGIAMLVLAMGLCMGLANLPTTVTLAQTQDDKMQGGDKMKDDKMSGDKMEHSAKTAKKGKASKKDKMSHDKMSNQDKMEHPQQ